MQQRATGRRGDTSTPSSSTTSPFSPSLYAWSRALTQQMGKVLLPLSFLLPTAGGVVASLAPGPPQAAMAAELNLLEQLETLNKQVVLQDKLLRMAKNNKFEKRLPTFPVVKDGVRLDAKTIQNAIDRIQVLDAYLDEVERDIYQREWKYVPGFLQTFVQQEDAFIQLIEGLYPGNGVADKSSREALSYEAQNLFVELDNLREASKFQRPKAAEKAYAKIALAYDRFLKAGDLYAGYDPVTSTEVFYNLPSLPKEGAIIYDNDKTPQVSDQIVVLGGPDMGKTGKLIGLDEGNKGVVKLDTNGAFTEVKIISMKDVGKQLPSK